MVVSIHIKVYKDYYLVHRDLYDPNIHPVKHLIFDAPKETLAGLFLIDLFLLNGRITNWAVNKITHFLSSYTNRRFFTKIKTYADDTESRKDIFQTTRFMAL
ncbi:MAG: hypothetical protein E6K87_04215 [Thaumarchaeota archaeon]|nr:MAG: hypothetical protein E6K87_04215 [Nitrososphaerota archaeon]